MTLNPGSSETDHRKHVPFRFRFPKSIGTTGFPLRKSAAQVGAPVQLGPTKNVSSWTQVDDLTVYVYLFRDHTCERTFFVLFVHQKTSLCRTLWSFDAPSAQQTSNLSTFKVAINGSVMLNMDGYICVTYLCFRQPCAGVQMNASTYKII